MADNNMKEINNKNRTYYYVDDLININDFDFENILLDEKSYKGIFIILSWLQNTMTGLCVLFFIK